MHQFPVDTMFVGHTGRLFWYGYSSGWKLVLMEVLGGQQKIIHVFSK